MENDLCSRCQERPIKHAGKCGACYQRDWRIERDLRLKDPKLEAEFQAKKQRIKVESVQKRKEKQLAWVVANRQKLREYDRSRNKSEKRKRQQKSINLKKWYGISIDDFDALNAIQSGLCAICGNPETKHKNGNLITLSVDHDHATGEVRELLCTKCNTGIGLFCEDPRLLTRAATYIMKFNGNEYYRKMFDKLYKKEINDKQS